MVTFIKMPYKSCPSIISYVSFRSDCAPVSAAPHCHPAGDHGNYTPTGAVSASHMMSFLYIIERCRLHILASIYTKLCKCGTLHKDNTTRIRLSLVLQLKCVNRISLHSTFNVNVKRPFTLELWGCCLVCVHSPSNIYPERPGVTGGPSQGSAVAS